MRLDDVDFGLDLRDRGRAVRARSRRQTEISVVRVFPAELFRRDRAQVVEFFDESQRIVSLRPGREVVGYVIPAPGGGGFVHGPSLAGNSAQRSPQATC